MGHAGCIFIGLTVLEAWRCVALHTKDGTLTQHENEAFDHRNSSSTSSNHTFFDIDGDSPAGGDVPSGTLGNETEIPSRHMRAGIGDMFNQIILFIMWAEVSNITAIHIPDKYLKKYKGFFEVPQDFQGRRTIFVTPRPDDAALIAGGCARDRVFRCSADARSRKRVMMQYIKPLLVPNARTDRHRRNDGSDELVIHIRSGDAWFKFSDGQGFRLLEYFMPPCAFYDKIIETGNKGNSFQHVRVVTESDHANPCVDLILQRHPHRNVTVQTESREEDAAAIMNARHLVTAQSHFSWTMAEMNEQLETLFVTDSVPPHYRGVVPCGSPGDPRVVVVTIPGLTVERFPPEKKKEWMIEYREEPISFREC